MKPRPEVRKALEPPSNGHNFFSFSTSLKLKGHETLYGPHRLFGEAENFVDDLAELKALRGIEAQKTADSEDGPDRTSMAVHIEQGEAMRNSAQIGGFGQLDALIRRDGRIGCNMNNDEPAADSLHIA